MDWQSRLLHFSAGARDLVRNDGEIKCPQHHHRSISAAPLMGEASSGSGRKTRLPWRSIMRITATHGNIAIETTPV
jgi:hypothetical protein